jgi:hypothetical protein
VTDETPETEAVRRLLAEARHDEPMPADVAARMDRVLADLATTPVTAPSSAPVASTEADETESVDGVITHLPVQRRRRAAGLLAAAAAIVVGGVVLAQNLPHGGSQAETAAGSASEGQSFSAGDAQGGGTRSPDTPAAAPSRSAPQGQQVQLRDGRVVVRSRSFPADAFAGRRLLAGQRSQQLVQPEAPCPSPSGQDQLVPALFRRAPAVLVYHRPDGSTQVVDLLVCGTGRPIRSVTLPAP